MTVSEILSIVTCILLVGVTVLIAVTFSRALQKVLDHNERASQRHAASEGQLLDRIMAMDFSDYKAQAMAESPNAPPAGQIFADDIPPLIPGELFGTGEAGQAVWNPDRGDYEVIAT